MSVKRNGVLKAAFTGRWSESKTGVLEAKSSHTVWVGEKNLHQGGGSPREEGKIRKCQCTWMCDWIRKWRGEMGQRSPYPCQAGGTPGWATRVVKQSWVNRGWWALPSSWSSVHLPLCLIEYLMNALVKILVWLYLLWPIKDGKLISLFMEMSGQVSVQEGRMAPFHHVVQVLISSLFGCFTAPRVYYGWRWLISIILFLSRIQEGKRK